MRIKKEQINLEEILVSALSFEFGKTIYRERKRVSETKKGKKRLESRKTL